MVSKPFLYGRWVGFVFRIICYLVIPRASISKKQGSRAILPRLAAWYCLRKSRYAIVLSCIIFRVMHLFYIYTWVAAAAAALAALTRSSKHERLLVCNCWNRRWSESTVLPLAYRSSCNLRTGTIHTGCSSRGSNNLHRVFINIWLSGRNSALLCTFDKEKAFVPRRYMYSWQWHMLACELVSSVLMGASCLQIFGKYVLTHVSRQPSTPCHMSPDPKLVNNIASVIGLILVRYRQYMNCHSRSSARLRGRSWTRIKSHEPAWIDSSFSMHT